MLLCQTEGNGPAALLHSCYVVTPAPAWCPAFSGVAGRRRACRPFLVGGGVTEQVAGLAAEHVAKPGERGEPDRFRPAVLQDRQVHDRDADPVGELGEGHAALGEQPVQVHLDRVPGLVGTGRHHTVPAGSSCIWAPRRSTRASVSSPRPTISSPNGRCAHTSTSLANCQLPGLRLTKMPLLALSPCVSPRSIAGTQPMPRP